MKSIPKKSIQEQVQLYIVAVKKLTKRMEAVEERPDFLQGLLDKKDKLVSPALGHYFALYLTRN